MKEGDEKSGEFMGDQKMVAAGSELNAWLGQGPELEVGRKVDWKLQYPNIPK
jgi:hypothetical protein